MSLRSNLATQYNNVLRQIDRLATDAGYQGKNLLIGSGLQVDATASSKTAVNALAGISGVGAKKLEAYGRQILRVLEQADVGWLRGIVEAGHPVGNHTYDHVNVTATRRRPSSCWMLARPSARETVATRASGTRPEGPEI